MSKRTAETNRVWVVTVNSANVTGLISFSGLYSTGQRLTTGLSMVNCVPPIIAMPADHDLTKENVVKFVNEHRRDYGTKLRGRKFEEKDVSIYSEETLIKMADDKNLGVTASTAKRARKAAIDDDSIQLGIAGLFDGAEEGEVVGDASPRLPTTVTPVPHSAVSDHCALLVYRSVFQRAHFEYREGGVNVDARFGRQYLLRVDLDGLLRGVARTPTVSWRDRSSRIKLLDAEAQTGPP